MILKSTLQKAAQQNIIESKQVEPLYQFIQDQKFDAQSDTQPDSRDEPLKFIRSFGDVFITLGIVLLVVAINMTNLSGYFYLIPAAGFVAVAEWLVRVRRLALPGIAILLSILFFVSKAVTLEHDNATLFELGVLSSTSLLFYFRYKMPFSLFPLTASLVAMVVVSTGINVLEHPAVFVGFGLVIFVIALWFDSRDTTRVSHLSDNAFWLYLLASPMIVHGVMVSMLLSDQTWVDAVNKEVLMIIFIVGIFLLALLIDRRAILISTQLYIIYALTQLLQNELNSTQNVLVYILIGLGLFVIYFGTYWYKSRRLIFGFLSTSIVSRYIPDLNTQDIKK
jgi:hypothetical protein